MGAERKDAIARLLEAIEGLTVEQISDLARKAELTGGWQVAMERAAMKAKTRQQKRPDTDELAYQDLVAFCEEIGVGVELAGLTWNKLFGMKGLTQSQVNELRGTPVSVGRLRERVSRIPALLSQPTLRRNELLALAWEKTL